MNQFNLSIKNGPMEKTAEGRTEMPSKIKFIDKNTS